MLNLDPAKLLVIGLIALVVLGPERLPRVARQLGAGWRELTRVRDQVATEVKAAFPGEALPRFPNISGSISSAISDFARTVPTSSAGDGGDQDVDEAPDAPGGSNSASTRQAPRVVVHGALGDFAFLPDDPSMN
ncbi:MAG TPA: twin-arginine translocase TatA/TatE family subunit [Acidimicrobiales bacterium]|jgi:sec-independent protein translocase protein TatB|nr:twin-arginine translocase TatA/TatE family subunit [Acidimicrobiales bacterium]